MYPLVGIGTTYNIGKHQCSQELLSNGINGGGFINCLLIYRSFLLNLNKMKNITQQP